MYYQYFDPIPDNRSLYYKSLFLKRRCSKIGFISAHEIDAVQKMFQAKAKGGLSLKTSIAKFLLIYFQEV
jgi:hypothetical protein